MLSGALKDKLGCAEAGTDIGGDSVFRCDVTFSGKSCMVEATVGVI